MFENKLNVWQGDGITNCLSFMRPNQRIKELIKLRDSNLTDSYTSKVYHWTIDSKWTIKDSLRLGVDGIITNEVSHIIEALKDDEFKSFYHLANNDDDPFCTVRDFELQSIRQNLNQFNSQFNDQITKQKLINNLMITNYVMQNESPAQQPLTTSQTLNPFLNSNQNFETDNLIRTSNDFKRTSFTDFNFNFRQLLTQLLSLLNRRNNYDENRSNRFSIWGRGLDKYRPMIDKKDNGRSF